MEHVYRQVMHYVASWTGRMGPQEWLVALGAMVIVACVCMRGFGSRSQY
jgi:hypothetical protein